MVQIVQPQYGILSQAIQGFQPITGAMRGIAAGEQLAQQLKAAPLEETYKKAQIDLAKAQAQRYREMAKSPFGGQPLSGPAAQAYSELLYKQKFAQDPQALQTLQNLQTQQQRSSNARIFWSLPVAERQQVVAKAKELGFDPVAATQLFSQGYTLQDLTDIKNRPQTILKTHDVLPTIQEMPSRTSALITQPSPTWQRIRGQYAPTSEALTRAQESAQGAAGLDYLGNYVANNIKYGGVLAEVTRPWFWDAHSDDPRKQEKAISYYTAQLIKPELSLARIRVQGGQPSARAMAALEPAVLGSLHVNLSHIPAPIQRAVARRVTNVLNMGAQKMQEQTLTSAPTIYGGSRPQIQESIQQTHQVNKSLITPENLAYTAKVNNMSVTEVKKRLGIE